MDNVARSIFIGGTGSNVGKSWMATALCRLLARRNVRVAPFKAQNMSNNSYPCPAGGEIGRSQVAQAEACGLAPRVEMNPVLLKPTGESRSQVILHGKVWQSIHARDYYQYAPFLRQEALKAYQELSSSFEVIVIEGAGSVAEINLWDRDFANLSMAHAVGARSLLVADIERGGVFASILGTLDLLPKDCRKLIRAFAVNRFRGDRSLFTEGVTILEEKSGLPCLGVFPFVPDLHLDAEDTLASASSFRNTEELDGTALELAASHLSIEDKLLMTLEYLREYRTYFHLGHSYGLSESACYRACKWFRHRRGARACAQL
jgi:adenosylcobyric acid synthase